MSDEKDTIKEPIKPVPSADLPWEEWSEGQQFGSRVQRLNPLGVARHVGVLIEELAPGKQSCPLHYHLLEEEHVFILEGSATLRLGNARYPVTAGDYVCFPAGQDAGHAFINEGATPCRYLVVGENNPNDVAIYPDSDKIFVRSTKSVFPRKAEVDYWQGEIPD
jgi:uncharacterized cupin superfamily protein